MSRVPKSTPDQRGKKPGSRVCPVDWTFCDDCQKRGYYSRKDAKKALRFAHRGSKGMREYPCPTRTDDLWHIGHMPRVTYERGTVSAADAIADRRRRRAS